MRRAALTVAVLILVTGAAAPLINAARFQQQIRQGLERGLQRKVEITGAVRFTLFSGPGFIAEDVLIAEDPRAGIEPFAYVAALTCRIRLRSLWTGKLEFSTLTLDEPSLNLVKIPGGPWNIQPFLYRAAAPGGDAAGALPDLRVRNARLNFKFGDTKSVFYLANADVDIRSLSGEGMAYSVAFSGEPARTDRAAQSFGRLSGRGRWWRGPRQESMLSMSAKWDRSPIAEFLLLWFGRDAGVNGHIAAEARFEGPLSDLSVSGRLQLMDLHRWDLMPARGEAWLMPFQGRLSLVEETATLETAPAGGAPLKARLRVTGLASSPQYGALLTFKDLPVAPVVETARRFGLTLPAKVESSGAINGAVGYSKSGGLQGGAAVEDLVLRAAGAEPVICPRLVARMDTEGLTVKAPRIQLERKNGLLAAEAGYAFGPGELEAHLTTSGVEALAFRNSLQNILGLPGAPFLAHLRSGRLKGKIYFSADAKNPGTWSGTLGIQDGSVEVPGVSEAVSVASAAFHFDGARLEVTRLEGLAGKIPFHGSYRYDPAAARPHQFHLAFAEVPAEELERLLAPAMVRRRGIIARTLRLASPPPEWLKKRRAEGRIEIASLIGPDWELQSVEGYLIWEGPVARIRDLKAAWENGALQGALALDLSRAAPAYQFSGTLKGAEWRGGTVDVEASLRSAGSGAEILNNLAGKGCFRARDVSLTADLNFPALSGCFLISASGSNKLEIAKLEALTLDQEWLSGKAVLRRNGVLSIELIDAKKRPLRLFGVFSPLKLEAAP